MTRHAARTSNTGPRPDRTWLVLADDMTGAADSSVAFASKGMDTVVGWGDCPDGAGVSPRVFSYQTDSRSAGALEAGQRQTQVLERFLSPGRTLFKKIDSTLRGQPAAEIAAAMATMHARFGSAFGILAPAFPKNGRTTVNGRVQVGGLPLEDTELWKRDHTYPTSDLATIVASAGVCPELVPLDVVRSGHSALRKRLRALAAKGDRMAVCDAVTQEDLEALARACLPAGDGTFFVGAGGLSHALASCEGGVAPVHPSLPPSTHGCLVAVGSLARASRAAARTLASTGRVFHVPVSPDVLLDENARTDRSTLASRVVEALDAGDDVLVEMLLGYAPSLADGRRITRSLASVLKPSGLHMSGLVVTGGETAGVLLSALGAGALRLRGEVLPGICLGLTLSENPLPVVTKAGAFGGDDCLVRCLDHLHGLRPNA